MEKALESVRTHTDSHDSQIKAIKKDLGVLKEKINEAREKASKVRIVLNIQNRKRYKLQLSKYS